MHDPDKLRRLPFSAVAEFWLSTREKHLKKETFIGYRLHVKNLNKFLGPVPPCKIHIGHVRRLQAARLCNEGNLWAGPVGASCINHEAVTLQQVLARCGEWEKIRPHYERLPVPRRKKPQIMSDAEEMTLWAVAVTNPDWELAYLQASLGVNTGAVGSELRNVRFADMHLEARIPGFVVQIETAKNEYRHRWVALNETALKHMLRCKQIAQEKGSYLPTHYLFPFRVCRGHYDPTKPATESLIRKPFRAMVEAAGIPHITPHCMRHQHATISLENGQSEFVVAKRLGHKNPTMLREIYGHGRQDEQKAGVDAIDPSIRFAPKREQIAGNVRAIR